MFAHLSDVPDFADKINIFIGLAPVSSLVHSTSALLTVLDKTHIAQILQDVGMYPFLQFLPFLPPYLYDLCTYLPSFCAYAISLVADKDTSVDNLARLPVILAHFPDGTSTRNMIHYQQMPLLKSAGFCEYDYGALDNMRVYANTTAPCYDLGKIKAPIAWWVGTDDRFCEPGDIDWLKTQINPEVLVSTTTLDKFGHFSVLWAKNMTYFEEVIETTRKYSTQQNNNFLS